MHISNQLITILTLLIMIKGTPVIQVNGSITPLNGVNPFFVPNQTNPINFNQQNLDVNPLTGINESMRMLNASIEKYRAMNDSESYNDNRTNRVETQNQIDNPDEKAVYLPYHKNMIDLGPKSQSLQGDIKDINHQLDELNNPSKNNKTSVNSDGYSLYIDMQMNGSDEQPKPESTEIIGNDINEREFILKLNKYSEDLKKFIQHLKTCKVLPFKKLEIMQDRLSSLLKRAKKLEKKSEIYLNKLKEQSKKLSFEYVDCQNRLKKVIPDDKSVKTASLGNTERYTYDQLYNETLTYINELNECDSLPKIPKNEMIAKINHLMTPPYYNKDQLKKWIIPFTNIKKEINEANDKCKKKIVVERKRRRKG